MSREKESVIRKKILLNFRKDLPKEPSRNDLFRLANKISGPIANSKECVIYPSKKFRRGLSVGKTVYDWFVGEVQGGKNVRRICTPSKAASPLACCVNPSHMFIANDDETSKKRKRVAVASSVEDEDENFGDVLRDMKKYAIDDAYEKFYDTVSVDMRKKCMEAANEGLDRFRISLSVGRFDEKRLRADLATKFKGCDVDILEIKDGKGSFKVSW